MDINGKHIISQQQTFLDALKRINEIKTEPLVLFAVDEQGSMCVLLLMVIYAGL